MIYATIPLDTLGQSTDQKPQETPDLPPDPDGMNGERANWADIALNLFRETTGTDHEDALADLLASLRHWADRNGMDWDHQLERADSHYQAETTGE